MVAPDNFLYFLTLFSFAVLSGSYLLFTFYVNRLLVLNAVVYFLSGARVASEYYIQQLGTFAEVEQYAPWHILPANLLVPLQWTLVWWYVRPFRNRSWETAANWFVTFGLCIIPFYFHSYYCSVDPTIYYYAPERIDGYWQFAINTDLWYYPYYRGHTNVMLLIVVGTLIVGVIRDKQDRLRQTFLLISYFVLPFIYFAMTLEGQWNIPSTGVVFLGHTLIISWYVSNYRLYGNNIRQVTDDLLDSISDLTISTDPQLQITGYNTRTSTILAPQSTDFTAWLRKSSVQPLLEEDLGRVLQDQGAERIVELLDRRGKQRTFALKAAPFGNKQNLLGYTFLLTDLTDIRAKEQELSRINTIKDRLFAIVGHDLRRWALAFRGIGEKIEYLRQGNDPEKLRTLSTSLEQAAFSLNSQLDNILKWALQQRGALTSRPKEVPLPPILDELLDTFAGAAAVKSIRLTIDSPARTQVYADPSAVLTILRNLIDNALKFTMPGGNVSVLAESDENRTSITITDSGIGIPHAERATLFELSERRGREGTDGEPGTGLGLQLVGELLKLNQGTIVVNSEPGKGTEMRLHFPSFAPDDELGAVAGAA